MFQSRHFKLAHAAVRVPDLLEYYANYHLAFAAESVFMDSN